MLKTYAYPKYQFRLPTGAGGDTVPRYPVVVVGAGPVGMAAAIDLAQQGVPVVILDDDDTVSVGSRGVCYAKRALEVLDRLGVGDPVVDKGVSWNVGRTFFREEEVYNFNLKPNADQKRPGMINLQQYYLEEYEINRLAQFDSVELCWKNKVVGVEPQDDKVTVKVQTPDGFYTLETDWLIVADGARSPIRSMLNLDIDGKIFMDRFLIADVVMEAEFPPERWFWFDPPFHPGQSVLLHRQSDNCWRIDFQLGWQADPEEEKKPEKVIPRIKAMLGDDRPFELEWVSVYTFQCRRMTDFRHGRVFFAGDCAHQVSPFGARGANSGIQDTDNLVWKLKLVMDGKAPPSLLDTYSRERTWGADENLMNSTRSTDFITPKSKTSLTFRNATLGLARKHPFARALVNSGRLSVPCFYTDSRLNTADTDAFGGDMVPGAAMDDASIRVNGEDGWLLDHVGNQFIALVYAPQAALAGADALLSDPIGVTTIAVVPAGGKALPGMMAFEDVNGTFAKAYDATPGSVHLLRPDQHVTARWRTFDAAAIRAAVARATCNS
ncbi:FAD-dependent oxidoreductase [Magnetospirillum sulfuroxidans]|uniref:FAD-dependent oxidoreductase n=1 Tax=Magnetospirillum sulfuroxidans TaxID=611300 RepID=UPI0031FF27DE